MRKGRGSPRGREPLSRSLQNKAKAEIPEHHHHNLQKIFDDLNRRYFCNSIEAEIKWGKALPANKARHATIRMGACVIEKRMIIVHRALDQSWVPRYFTRYVIFHEMLHLARPIYCRRGVRVLHSKEFRNDERSFPLYNKARAWEIKNINQLLYF